MAKMKDGCVKPARGPMTPATGPAAATAGSATMEATSMHARVGQEAPDFEANAFIADKGFEPIKLSDFKGKWIVLCFYPGDFTFV
jgi:peroxiredoxin (alkyl hydroperoxide reductase subunit C)